MANRVMDVIRHFFGYETPPPQPMTGEQQAVAERLRRISARERAIRADAIEAQRRIDRR